MTASQSPHVLVLAAGQGKRMVSELPKVVHPVLFRPMIHYVLDLALSIPNQSVTVVVGHGESKVREACESYSAIQFARQEKQRGTADAVNAVEGMFRGKKGTLLILSGDVICLTKSSLEGMLKRHFETGSACTVATAHLTDPSGYGRILRGGSETIAEIREDVDCSAEEKTIGEINGGLYCFSIELLFPALAKVHSHNNQSEFYLTDVVRILTTEGKRVTPYLLKDASEITGINDRVALHEVEQSFKEKINRKWMLKGVTLLDPQSTWIDSQSSFEQDTYLENGCFILNSSIGRGSRIESNCRIIDTRIEANVHVKQGSYLEKSEIGSESSVGPYAHLRPESILDSGVKIGNFVEVKKSRMGKGSKASHLSYVGDAEIGADVNLGCGFITCNYDGGPKKHKTIIGDNVFVGSDSQTVAPVKIGSGSYVASGSTVTEDVPPDSLVVSRGRQTTKEGYAKKYRQPK